RDAGVAEDLLHGAQVGTTLEQVRGGRVAEPVRAEIGCAVDGFEPGVDERTDRSGIQPGTLATEEDGRPAARPGEQRSTGREITAESGVRGAAVGHGPLLVALAEHADHETSPVDVVQV